MSESTLWIVVIIGLIVLGAILYPPTAKPHAGERTALYNLSGLVHRMGKQLDRIEDRLINCNRGTEK